eukprot:TRINITY_DN27508_c0_g1_i1.p1 TRINITY_DN27508_c0_g1~~TRINITY_DN27508_c0_g1_i1.p1  ORF type:complete len:431 (+),score=133.13 TRINITY_DN27508_c0_g1_i1:99-1295(+)
MVLSDKAFGEALKAIRGARKGADGARLKRIAKVVPESLRPEVEEWAEHGIEGRRGYGASDEHRKHFDAMNQWVDVDREAQDMSFLKRPETLFVGVAVSGLPEYSRYNVGGVCLRELASQCGGQWRQARGKFTGYYCRMRPEMWYMPGAEKRYLNRHYEDVRAEYLKHAIMKAKPQSMLYVPTVPIENFANAVCDFMYEHKFHPNQLTLVAPERHYQVGQSKYIPVGMDEVFARGLPAVGKGASRLPRPHDIKAKGYKELRRKLKNKMKLLRVGTGAHLPDDGMIVFSEKERVFMREYQFPLLHHSMYLTAAGFGDDKIGEAVQRPVDEARITMEETENAHVHNLYEARDAEGEAREAVRQERRRAADAAAADTAAHARHVRASAVGRFMAKRRPAASA